MSRQDEIKTGRFVIDPELLAEIRREPPPTPIPTPMPSGFIAMVNVKDEGDEKGAEVEAVLKVGRLGSCGRQALIQELAELNGLTVKRVTEYVTEDWRPNLKDK